MKIVHVLPALTKGGAERVAVDLANAAAADGHQVSFILGHPVDPTLPQNDLDPRIELHFVRRRRARLGEYASLPGWLLRNRQWLLGQDIVHCHLTFGGIAASLIQRLRGRGRRGPAVVETYHAVGMAIPGWKRALHAHLLDGRDAVALMALDPYWAQFQARRPGRLIAFIPNGVAAPPAASAAAVAAYRERAGLPREVKLVGSVGRLLAERRPDLLVETFAQIAAGFGHDVHLMLGGEGPERAAIQSQAARLGVADRVHLLGLVRDLSGPFSAIDLYLTINVGAVTGIAAIEAAMAGLPVLAVQLDDEYRGSASDWIWSSSDPKTVARRAIELLGDPAALARLASAQHAHAIEHHSVERMAQAYQRFYEAALESRQGKK